jgi:hypothetical protein
MSSVDSRSVCNLLKQRCSQCIVHIAKNCTLLHPALIAQLGERQTEDLKVASSILAEGTNLFAPNFARIFICMPPPESLLFSRLFE